MFLFYKMIFNKILKSLDEPLYLIYKFYNYDYFKFYVQGKSNYIYYIEINKNHQYCNCESFKSNNFCKHIFFILFKVFKIFKLNQKENKIFLVSDNRLIFSNFLESLKFTEDEWSNFKCKFMFLKDRIKSSVVNKKLSYIFDSILKNYNTNFKSNIFKEDSEKCVICLENSNDKIKCKICNSFYHMKCLILWFSNKSNKKCPTCSSEHWNILYLYMIIYMNIKIPIEILKIENI